MILPGRARKAALTAHLAASVGWLGAVAAFLALAVAGLTSGSAETVRAAYIAMALIAWFVIVPLALASLATGLVQSLGTPWGLFRHYWVVVKLAVTLLAVTVLLLQLGPIGHVAEAAAERTLARDDLRAERISLAAHAAGGLVVLLVPLLLGVLKPRGLTRHGRRGRNDSLGRAASGRPSRP